MTHWYWLLASGWGAGGGALMSLGTFFGYVQNSNEWPWRAKNGPTGRMWVTVEVIRVALGAGVAAVLGATDHLGVLSAVTVGAGAPAILDQWKRAAPGLAIPRQRDPLDPPGTGGHGSGEPETTTGSTTAGEGGV